jgi:hypothetical protein
MAREDKQCEIISAFYLVAIVWSHSLQRRVRRFRRPRTGPRLKGTTQPDLNGLWQR